MSEVIAAPNHLEAMQLASLKRADSNLARAYLDLLKLLVNVTHHEGALAQFEPKWGPIVAHALRIDL